MKPENVAVVFTDADTGKAYAAVLNESETLVIMAMLSGLQDGAIRAREVIPFELRRVPPKGIAGLLAQALHSRNGAASLIGMEVSAQITRRTVARGTGQYSGGVQQIAKPHPEVGEVITCYACNRKVRKREVLSMDGFCPLCDVEISDEEDFVDLCTRCGTVHDVSENCPPESEWWPE